MTDPIQLENTINAMRNDLAGLTQRIEVFGLLPQHVRGPILDRLDTMLQELREGVSIFRATVEHEVAKQRGDDVDDYRKAFRQAT